MSNSKDQRLFIEKKCQERGFENVKVITGNINGFSIDEEFGRVVLVEMTRQTMVVCIQLTRMT